MTNDHHDQAHSAWSAAQPGAASAAICDTNQYDIHNRSSEILVSC
jgi:hypothetical protein